MGKIIRPSFLFLGLFVIGCAGQFPPSGGPIDKTPPVVVSSSPSPNQLNFNSPVIRLEFDKYMVDRSVESSLFFPPFELNDLTFDWSGKSVEIKLKKEFEKNRTYILTIGARAQDLRGNYLGKAYNIVFSTGSQIDTGMISGMVYSSRHQPYTVAAFPVTPDIDTLHPSLTMPRYVTQSDDSGRYVLQGLGTGSYRLLCFDDQMRNFVYAPQMDSYASATHDVGLDSRGERISDVNFAVSMEDTSHPQLYSSQLANDGLLLLKFSEPLDTAHLQAPYFVVRDSATGDTIPVDFAVRTESNEYNVVIRTASALKPRTKYFVTAADSLRDSQQNRMSTDNKTVVMETDSASVSINPYYFSFRDSTKGITSYDTLFCQFVIPAINGIPTLPEVSVLDDSGKALRGRCDHGSGSMYFADLKKLSPSNWYTLRLRYHSDSSGHEKDSVVSMRFRMADSTSLGDLEGNVSASVGGNPVVVCAYNQTGKGFYTLADGSGNFSLDALPAGDYTVWAFVKHGNGLRYYSGRSFPYRFAEPFGVYHDRVKVRARWTTEGVSIELR